MALMHSEYKARLAHWQRVLAADFYHPFGEICFEGFTTMEHLRPEEAARGMFHPVEEGRRGDALCRRTRVWHTAGRMGHCRASLHLRQRADAMRKAWRAL